MNPITLSAIHRTVTKNLQLPLAAINILKICESTFYSHKIHTVVEFNDGNYDSQSYLIDKDSLYSPFIHKYYNHYSYICIKEIYPGVYENLPDIRLKLTFRDDLYQDAVKKILNLSYMTAWERAKFLYPSLFENLNPKYNSFYCPLDSDPIGKTEEEQDIYIKLLAAFNISVHPSDELFYHKRLVQITGLLAKVENGQILVKNEYLDRWTILTLEDKIKYSQILTKELTKTRAKHLLCH